MYGYLEFGLSAVENALSNITDNEKGIKGSVEKDVVEYFLHSAKAYSIRKSIDGTLKKDVTVAMQFQHLGHIIYYDSSEAKPQVCIDDPNGILTDAEGKTSPLPQFRDITYVPVKTGVVPNLLFDHMYIIFGPGLTLNWQPWFEKKLCE